MLQPVDDHCVLFGLNGSKVSGTHFMVDFKMVVYETIQQYQKW